MDGFPLIEVNVAQPAGDDATYNNMRAELWGRMRRWLETAEIPDDQELEDQLCSLQYGSMARAGSSLKPSAI